MIINLIVPSPPSLNALYGRMRNGQVYKKAAHNQFTSDVQKICLKSKIKPFKGTVAVELHWFRPNRRLDIDNALKTLLDALQGFLYENDSQIVELFIRKDYDKDLPRMVIKCYECE